MKTKTLLASALAITALAGAAIADEPVAGSAQRAIVLRVDRVYIGTGAVIEDARVVVRDGRIVAIGRDVEIPSDADVIDLPTAMVTPGLIDANAILEPTDQIGTGETAGGRGLIGALMHQGHDHADEHATYLCDGTMMCSFASTHDDLPDGQVCPVCGQYREDDPAAWASGVDFRTSHTEGSSEVVAHTRVADSIDLSSPDFERLLRGGVTTVFAAPDSAAVIGPQGAIVRTAGPLRDRIVVDAGPVQAAIGGDPMRVGGRNGSPSRWSGVNARTRRPNSRMGVAWVFRKAFYDAALLDLGSSPSGADLAEEEALRVVQSIRTGEVPLRIHARTQRDIETAMRLADEFGLQFTLVEATEAHGCLEKIKERSMPIVYGPIDVEPSGLRAWSREVEDFRLATLPALLDSGLDVALTAQDLREEDGLARQAMYAMRAGLSREDVIRCVTLAPARLLGIDNETGSLESGKRADLVVWSGEPFDATSRPLLVMIGGHIEFDAREN